MQKRYVALSTWIDKNSHIPKSSLAEIKEGKNKAGDSYQISDTNSTMIVDEHHPVGEIICYTMTVNSESSSKAATIKS